MDVKVKLQDQVLYVAHLGHVLHAHHACQLHVISHARCYCFLSILHNGGLMQLERRKVKGYKLLCLFKTMPNRS